MSNKLKFYLLIGPVLVSFIFALTSPIIQIYFVSRVTTEIFAAGHNEIVEEACRALIMLGFSKQNVNKAVQSILKANPKAKVEDVIKSALKML